VTWDFVTCSFPILQNWTSCAIHLSSFSLHIGEKETDEEECKKFSPELEKFYGNLNRNGHERWSFTRRTREPEMLVSYQYRLISVQLISHLFVILRTRKRWKVSLPKLKLNYIGRYKKQRTRRKHYTRSRWHRWERKKHCWRERIRREAEERRVGRRKFAEE